jgi:hypothetical protein
VSRIEVTCPFAVAEPELVLKLEAVGRSATYRGKSDLDTGSADSA